MEFLLTAHQDSCGVAPSAPLSRLGAVLGCACWGAGPKWLLKIPVGVQHGEQRGLAALFGTKC